MVLKNKFTKGERVAIRVMVLLGSLVIFAMIKEKTRFVDKVVAEQKVVLEFGFEVLAAAREVEEVAELIK